MSYSERELLKYKYQKRLFDKLDNTDLFICTKDLQGGDWCVGFVGTTKDFVARAIEWEWSDGYLEEDKKFINNLLENKDNKSVLKIADFWSIEIKSINTLVREHYGEDYTETEKAFVLYLLGQYTYQDYLAVCNIGESEPYKDIKSIILKDNESEYGGTEHHNETLGNFIEYRASDNLMLTIKDINKALKECGIEELTEEQVGGAI